MAASRDHFAGVLGQLKTRGMKAVGKSSSERPPFCNMEGVPKLTSIDFFCLDVDGVLTDGTFLYSETGKEYKRFGPEDSDALQVLSRFIRVEFVTADRRGYKISQSRIEKDMGFPVHLVGSSERLEWIAEKNDLDRTAYMGDSFVDIAILKAVAIGFAPSNAGPHAQSVADYVTSSSGGRGAVAEACFVLADKLGLEPPEFSFLREGR